MSSCVNDCSKTNEDKDDTVSNDDHKTNEECSVREDQANPNAPDPEVLAAEKVLNAFLYYKRFGREKICQIVVGLKQLPTAHQLLVGPSHSEHIRNVLKGIDHNHGVLKKMVIYGLGMFGEEFSNKAMKMHQNRRPTPTYMSKVLSTLRQIVREWSDVGKPERDATYIPIIEELRKRYPQQEERPNIQVFVPGSGLGRLAWELVLEGFTVEGNEYSLFMLMTSCFLLNGCSKVNEFTIYPYVLEKSNSWSYADQLQTIQFPDICPTKTNPERPNLFSMCAGNFLEISSLKESVYDCIVTAWFIDTANNIIEYIEAIYRVMKPGGIWVNVGPLTYHFEDMEGEVSLELPYEEVMRIVRLNGFQVEKEARIESKYTANPFSMLQNHYTCALFVATKTEPSKTQG